ncbi:hypothetical protein M8C21_033114, partial [Ambrosia artemisiifolia]
VRQRLRLRFVAGNSRIREHVGAAQASDRVLEQMQMNYVVVVNQETSLDSTVGIKRNEGHTLNGKRIDTAVSGCLMGANWQCIWMFSGGAKCEPELCTRPNRIEPLLRRAGTVYQVKSHLDVKAKRLILAHVFQGVSIYWGWEWLNNPGSSSEWEQVGRLMNMLHGVLFMEGKDVWSWDNNAGKRFLVNILGGILLRLGFKYVITYIQNRIDTAATRGLIKT